MNPPLDPFDALRRLNPVDSGTLPGADSAEGRELLERIVAEPKPTIRGRFRWLKSRKQMVAVALVLGLMTAAGAVAWALTRNETQHLTVGCYRAANLEADTIVVPAAAASPVGACQVVWRQGSFGTGPPPPLQACVLPSGAVGVFPNSSGHVCQQLGLTEAQAAEPTAAATVRLKEALVDRFLGQSCLNEREALQIVRAELRRRHLSTWRVRAAGAFSTPRPCATLAFDEERQLILLVPAPRH